MPKSIPVRKTMINCLTSEMSDFLFEGANGDLYSFIRSNVDGLFDHIIIQRDFYKGTGGLVVSEVATCYNRNWRTIPCFTVGKGTSLGVLVTGKNYYLADTGRHNYGNTKDGLIIALHGVIGDIKQYVLPYFEKCHKELAKEKVMKATHNLIIREFQNMESTEIESFKKWMQDSNRAYAEYRKSCSKENRPVDASVSSVDLFGEYPLFDNWVNEISISLGFPKIKDNTRRDIDCYVVWLFRDFFSYYN